MNSYLKTETGARWTLKTVLLLLFSWAVAGEVFAEPYGSGWYGEVQAIVAHEDNISRSFVSADQVSDEIVTVSIGGGHSRKIGNTGQLVLFGYVAFNSHQEYDDLDNFATTMGGTYTHQFSPGYDAVWYVLDGRFTILDYENSDEREGVLFSGDLSANRRLGDSAAWHFGFRYTDLVFVGKSREEELRDAAFDTASNEVYAGIDYLLKRETFLYAEYAFRRGAVWSNASHLAGTVPYDQETIDRVFDDCAPNDLRCQPRYAGRTKSDVHRVNAGIVFPFRSTSVDVSAVYYDMKGDNGVSYKDWIVSVGVIWNF